VEETQFTMRRLVLSEYRLVYYGACYCCCFILLHISLSLTHSLSTKLFFSSFFLSWYFFCDDEEFWLLLYGLSGARERERKKLLSDAMPARKKCVCVCVHWFSGGGEEKSRDEFSPFHSFKYFDTHFLCAQFSPLSECVCVYIHG
jgi:hypothetical protein